MQPERRHLVVDLDAASAVRLEAGPVPWVVLEGMAGLAPAGSSLVEVACSARLLADLLGTSKDTVARALRSLLELGVVERLDHRDELSGQFLGSIYQLDLARVGLSVTVSTPDTRTAPEPTVRTYSRTAADQLNLLD
jgi:hypothetical protein